MDLLEVLHASSRNPKTRAITYASQGLYLWELEPGARARSQTDAPVWDAGILTDFLAGRLTDGSRSAGNLLAFNTFSVNVKRIQVSALLIPLILINMVYFFICLKLPLICTACVLFISVIKSFPKYFIFWCYWKTIF